MRIAVPEWQGRVSPVFDFAEQIVLLDIEDESGVRRCRKRFGSVSLHERARRLSELKVELVICGAISQSLEGLIVARHIRVIPLICGEVEDVIHAFQTNTLDHERFAMPGCGGGCRANTQDDRHSGEPGRYSTNMQP